MKILLKYLILIICLFISACYFNLLQFPNKIITGGIAGISIIINNYFNIEPDRIILAISVLLLIIGLFLLGIKNISGTIIASIIYPFFISITKNISDVIKVDLNIFTISILLGILGGITTGIVYKMEFSNGGLSILSQIIAKYTKLSLSKTVFILNFIIVLMGSIFLNISMILYAGIILLINSFLISIILNKKT